MKFYATFDDVASNFRFKYIKYDVQFNSLNNIDLDLMAAHFCTTKLSSC